jgi:hypothetical protein
MNADRELVERSEDRGVITTPDGAESRATSGRHGIRGNRALVEQGNAARSLRLERLLLFNEKSLKPAIGTIKFSTTGAARDCGAKPIMP